MSNARARMLPWAGLACLVGQGALLGLAGRGGGPQLLLPGLFLLTTVGLAVALAFCGPGPGGGPPSRFWRQVSLLGVSAQLALSLWSLTAGGVPHERGPDAARSERHLAEAGAALESLDPALAVYRRVVAGALAAPTGGGDSFRVLAPLVARWSASYDEAAVLPVEVIRWSGGQRLAWTAGARPLDAPRGTGAAAEISDDRGVPVYRTFGPLDDGMLELQVAMDPDRLARRWPGLVVAVPHGGGSARRVPLGGEAGNGLALSLDTERGAWNGGTLQARLLVGLLATWSLVTVGFVRVCGGRGRWLAAMWIVRALLAAVDAHQWLAAGWPARVHPAPPASLASLVDPAYFATPFMAGWFASAADSLLTALVFAVTVWQFAQATGPASTATVRGRGPGSGLVFGLASGAVLLAIRGLATLLAENANARLLGQGVSLSSLSFWVLHAALMLLSLGLAVVVVRAAASRGWPDRSRLGPWLAGGAVAAAAAVLVTLPLGSMGADLRVGLGLAAAALWGLAPGLGASAGLRRRLTWVLVLMVVTCWNHAVLREVYAAAERGWLESKGRLIAESDPEWRSFLLEDVLGDMRSLDGGGGDGGDGADLWRHEDAWRLWHDSALRDLGLPCLVEVVDAEGQSESLHATGFLRDFRYEVAERSAWRDADGQAAPEGWDVVFQTERRLYAGGGEEILLGETVRLFDAGWIHVEVPVRSWRISTLMAQLTAGSEQQPGRYRPRSEIDRPVLLMRADDRGWLDAGASGFPGPESAAVMAALRSGERAWADLEVDGRRWLCLWKALPAAAARTPGEGFVLGLGRTGVTDDLLDLSRLLLLNLVLLLAAAAAVQGARLVGRRIGDTTMPAPWSSGFQERFLAGYLLLGLVLLLLLGTSVDRLGHDKDRAEARSRARTGLVQAVDQLRNLLIEQARSLAASEYIAELLVGQLAGNRPAGPLALQQGMVFAADGTLLLDETLSDLDGEAAAGLLASARGAPMIIAREGQEIFVGTVIPIDLADVLAEAPRGEGAARADDGDTEGFFFYRQRLETDLLASLADLVGGEITLLLGGQPVLASHPGRVFAGEVPRLASPSLMEPMLEHPAGKSVLAVANRPFAHTGCQPLPAFVTPRQGGLVAEALPAVLTVDFPDREREYGSQRRGTVLYLAGLANLILLAALLLAVGLSWNIFRPLRVLMAATRSLAQGDYAAPLPDPGRDEVGRLADAFGRMRGELRTAQDRLAARERFLTTVLDRVTVGVAVITTGGEVAALNPAGRHILTDYRPGETEEDAAVRLRDELAALRRGGARAAGELRSADGRHTLRGAMAPLDLPDGRTDTMLVFEDVTEFLEAQKMAINAELARQVAHEIKNPLTPIQLSVQLLHQAWRDGHPDLDRIVDETVERVLAQVELLRRIAAEFSLLGRPDALQTEPLDLGTLAAETIAAYTADRERGPRVDLVQQEVPPVLGDLDSVRKILGNLMQNSLDAADPDRGLVLRVRWRIGPDRVTMVWSDEGTGIDGDVAGRLFEPYFSTKSKGTGLGLAICRNLADRMGGTISLANRREGPGAVAELTLMRAGDDSDGNGNP